MIYIENKRTRIFSLTKQQKIVNNNARLNHHHWYYFAGKNARNIQKQWPAHRTKITLSFYGANIL